MNSSWDSNKISIDFSFQTEARVSGNNLNLLWHKQLSTAYPFLMTC